MATRAYFLTQIPHPIHSTSDMKAILSVDFTSIHRPPAKVLHSQRRALSSENGRWRTHLDDRAALCMTSRQLAAAVQNDPSPTFLHSCAHLFGLHRSESTTQIAWR